MVKVNEKTIILYVTVLSFVLIQKKVPNPPLRSAGRKKIKTDEKMPEHSITPLKKINSSREEMSKQGLKQYFLFYASLLRVPRLTTVGIFS